VVFSPDVLLVARQDRLSRAVEGPSAQSCVRPRQLYGVECGFGEGNKPCDTKPLQQERYLKVLGQSVSTI